MTAFSVSP